MRWDVVSNLSTTTCNFPADALAISLTRATIWSRPQPAPRFGSLHEESELRDPHATSRSISSRMDFSSTLLRAIAPDGRRKIFGLGLFSAGSAGSSPVETCAASGAEEKTMSPRSNTSGARTAAARRTGLRRNRNILRLLGSVEQTAHSSMQHRQHSSLHGLRLI